MLVDIIGADVMTIEVVVVRALLEATVVTGALIVWVRMAEAVEEGVLHSSLQLRVE